MSEKQQHKYPTPFIQFDDIKAAQHRLNGQIIRTPLIPSEFSGYNKQIFLKLENLQLGGSFKIRGVLNTIMQNETINRSNEKDTIVVSTASTGNFGLALARAAKLYGVKAKVYVPSDGSDFKRRKIQALGAETEKVSRQRWFNIFKGHECVTDDVFVEPFHQNTIEGMGTIGLEIFEDLPEIGSIIVPYGGGACIAGIASAIHHLDPNVQIYGAESENTTPLSTSLKNGKPSSVENFWPSFADGLNSPAFVPDMWKIVSNLVSGSIVVSLEEVRQAAEMLMLNSHIVAEGSAATALAAALKDHDPPLPEPIVCLISGGNIEKEKILDILNDKIPSFS